MTASPTMMGGSDTSIARYEELRRGVLAQASACDLGQIFLFRGGIVAWMAHEATRTAPTKLTADRQRDATSVVSDEIQAGIVRVLANMALAGRREMTQ